LLLVVVVEAVAVVVKISISYLRCIFRDNKNIKQFIDTLHLSISVSDDMPT